MNSMITTADHGALLHLDYRGRRWLLGARLLVRPQARASGRRWWPISFTPANPLCGIRHARGDAFWGRNGGSEDRRRRREQSQGQSVSLAGCVSRGSPGSDVIGVGTGSILNDRIKLRRVPSCAQLSELLFKSMLPSLALLEPITGAGARSAGARNRNRSSGSSV